MTASDAISFRSEPVPVAATLETPLVVDARPERPTPPMRLLPLPRSRESVGERWLWTAIALVVASLYLYTLLSFWAPANPGTDQNGYLFGGRQFAHTLSTGYKPESDFGFVGRMWVTAPSGINYPKYPLGLPILYAASLWIFGEARGVEYAHLVSPISAALAALGLFAIARRLCGGFLGVMAMLLLACGQVMLTLADNPNSHAACTCAVVWGMFFLLRWLELGTIWRGILAGLFFAFAYLIRYTEGLLLLPIGVAMLYAARWTLPRPKRAFITIGATIAGAMIAFGIAWFMRGRITDTSWLSPLADGNGRPFKVLVVTLSLVAILSAFVETRSLVRLLAIGFAWLVPVAYLTLFNMRSMQAFTSYAGTNESTGFAWSYFAANWEKMIRVVHDQGAFFIAPLGVLGIVVMFRRLPIVAAILTLWFLPSVLLYTAYYWAPDNMGVAYSRFILTQIPALIIAAVWLMGLIIRHPLRNATGRLAVGAIVFVSCALGTYRAVFGLEWGQRLWVRAALEIQGRQNMNLAGFGQEVRRAIDGTAKDKAARTIRNDSDVLLFADGERVNHLQWIGGWEMFDTAAFNYERMSREISRTITEDNPDPIDPSRIKFLQRVYDKKDQRALQADQNATIASALKSGKRVFYALTDNGGKIFERQLDRRQFDVSPVGSFNDVPAPRVEDDFLLPNERPKQPVNRMGRVMPLVGPNFLGNERLTYRIGQVVLKPGAAAATLSVATTKPTTKP